MKILMKSGLLILAGTLSTTAMPLEAKIVTMPQPIGGIPALCELVTYPDQAICMGMEGNVLLRFRIDEYGNVSNIQVIRSGGYLFDQAAIAAVSRTEWIPASHNSKNYAVLYQLPFQFHLE